MLAYMLSREAKEYHLELSDRLAKRFRLTPVSSRIDPHLTLKAPFGADDISDVRKVLKRFVQKEVSEPLTLTGINYFPKRVVYMDVQAPKQTYMFLRRLQDQLRNVSWLSFSSYEFPLTLHATLCYTKNPQQVKEILSYLGKEKISEFELELDNVTLLEKGVRWEAVETYSIDK